ncbi:tetratricopeptide repeat protein [Legionella dresdenensis]|uniref:Tetratricopeptide repeat protein n=1 Tax=Legionella dresdenensis TaxID=450200 RepID=A0ABV8CHJ3_9GAMM
MDKSILQQKLELHLLYLEQDENNPNLHLSISGYYRALGNLESAQHHLEQAKTLSGLPFWKHEGVLALDSQHFEQAIKAFEHALAEEDNANNRYNLAFGLYLHGEAEQALAVINQIPEQQKHESGEFLRARILYALRFMKEAIFVLESLYNPEDAAIIGLLAILHFDNGNAEKAHKYSEQALALNPENFEATLTSVLLRTLDKQATASEVEELIVSYPQESRLWFALGTIYMTNMKLPAAEKAFLQAAKYHPEFYDNWISLGWCYLLQDNITQAKNAYGNALKLSDAADGWGGLAVVHALTGNFADAESAIQKTRTSDLHCFLAAIAEVIINLQTNKQQCGALFNQTFPESASTMQFLLSQAVNSLNPSDKTLH